MPEEVKPSKPTLKSTNARIDKLELHINDEVIATQEYCNAAINNVQGYCKESLDNYDKLIVGKEHDLYSMLLGIFSCLAVIEFLQLFSAIGNMFVTTADCIFIGAKFFVFCWACFSCYTQGHLGEKRNYD